MGLIVVVSGMALGGGVGGYHSLDIHLVSLCANTLNRAQVAGSSGRGAAEFAAGFGFFKKEKETVREGEGGGVTPHPINQTHNLCYRNRSSSHGGESQSCHPAEHRAQGQGPTASKVVLDICSRLWNQGVSEGEKAPPKPPACLPADAHE